MKTKKIVVWCAVAGGAAAIALILLFIIAAVLLLSFKSFDFTPSPHPQAVIKGVKDKIQDEMTQAFDGNEEGATAGAASTRKIELTAEEVNAIISEFILPGARQWAAVNSRGAPPPELDAVFSDGVIRLRFTKRLTFRTPFGSCLNTTILFAPSIKDKSISLGLRSVTLGDVNLPNFMLSSRNAEQSKAIMASPVAPMLLQILDEFRLEKDKAVIVYRKAPLTMFVMSQMMDAYAQGMIKSP